MKKLALVAILSFAPGLLNAQNTGTGILPFGSYTQGGFDTINNQNLNVILSIPIVSSAGRNFPLALNLSYNSQIYSISGGIIFPATNFGWQWDMPPGGTRGDTVSTEGNIKCLKPGWPLWTSNTYYSGYYFTDALGVTHSFPISWTYIGCGGTWSGTGSAYASDLTGYYMTSSDGGINSVTGPGGTQYPSSNSAVDSNGNYVSRNVVSSTETDWTDSVGNKALKIIYTPNNTSPTQIQYQFLDQNGNYQTITLKFQTLSIATSFACNAVTEYTGSATVPTELDIPSPQGSGTILKYTFAYEPTTSGHYSGRLQKVILPTGGFYEYDYPAPNDGVNCSDGSALNMNRKVSDGTNSAIWSYVRNTSSRTTTMTTPQLADTPNANNTVYTFNSTGQEVTRQIYADSGVTLWRTINTTWAANGTPATAITILEDGSTQSKVASSYDSNGLLDSVTEYDFGSGSPGGAIRTTSFSYLSYIINRVTSKVIKDGSGAVQYRQDIGYDGAALSCPTGVPQHYETGSYTCSSNARGNATSVTTYTSPGTPSGGITKNFTYDWFGNLLTAQLNCCTQKTWTYSATTQYSQPDSVTSGTSPNQLTSSYTYNLYLGLVSQSKDPNNLITNYTYDFLRRTTKVSHVNGQTVSYSYNDSAPFSSTTTTTIDSSKSVQQVSSVDGLGRVLVSTTEDGSSNVFSNVSANYDLIGRAYKTSNPYTGSPSYWTTTAFDVLGRPTSVTLPDGSATTYSPYSAQYTTVIDPAGKKRKSQIDGAGRLVALTEPDTSGNLVNTTYYTYNVMDELIGVADAPSNPTQSRTYAYDALGRLFTAKTPEGGTTCFGTTSGGSCTANTGYDNFGNLLYRTDARGVMTSYTYDGLNRLKGVSYNVGSTGVPATASISLTYGTNASQFNNGALITMTDGVGSENYSYNALEQLTQLQKVISGTTYTTNYQYNIAGELTQITYPSGRVVQQSVDAIGRLCEIAPSTTGCGSAASPYATGYSYSVAGQVTGFKYGNGIYASVGFSSDRLQPSCLDYSTTNRSGTCAHDSTTKFGLNYSYGSAGSNNGLISGITDSVDNGRTVAYTYDPLSRLSAALTTGSTNYPQWGLSWGYDRYGNRLNQTLTAGSGYQGSVTVSAVSNHITTSGYAYDANGNMTNDGINTLVYDAENHAVSSSGTLGSGNYTYDGNGHRVQKVSNGNTTVYVFSGSKVIGEYDGEGGVRKEYVYGGGTLLAEVGGSGLSNGGFEQGLTGWSTGGTTQLISDSTRAHSGNDYVQLSAQPGSRSDVWSQYVAVNPGDQVTFGGWGYLESGTGCCTRWLLAAFSNNYGYVGAVTGSVSNVISASWTYSVGTYTVPAGVAYVQLDGQIYMPTTASVARIDDGFLITGTKYYHQDHLSNRLVTDSAGNTLEQMGHYPFGDPWYNATNDKLYFTTYERDAESNNDYAMARYYVWRIGRFTSLDPRSGSTSDPQSLNRYNYAANDPIGDSDPSGACIPPGSPVLGEVHQGFQCPPNTMGGDTSFGGYAFDQISVDGILMNPAQAGAILSIPGLAVQCPNSGCSGIKNNNGVWQQWVGGGEVQSQVIIGFNPDGTPVPVPDEGTTTSYKGHWETFYNANLSIGFASWSLSYVPSTKNWIVSPGVGTKSLFAGSLTKGWSKKPEDFLTGWSGGGCAFYVVGGCAGMSPSGTTAFQLGIGNPQWGFSGGYGLDWNTFTSQMFQGIPVEYPIGAIQIGSGLSYNPCVDDAVCGP